MRDSSLHRLIKQSSASPTGDPGTDAMAAAAEAAKGPAGMPLLKSIATGKGKEGDESKEALRMAHELDSKAKEINGLRQQLQESKMEAMRTQLKADIASEQTKMRESLREEQDRMRDSLRQEQQKMKENLRNEQIKVQDQIRKEQKELDRQQAKIQLEEAQQKGEMTAAQAQDEAQRTAAEAQYQAQFTQAAAEQKAQMAIEEAQHKAQLDSDTAAHDVEIAQHKADSLLDIATQTTDLYNKQMEKARAGADQYFSGQQKQYAASHPVISPALQSRLDGAMQSVGRLGKALNDFTKQSSAGDNFDSVVFYQGQGIDKGYSLPYMYKSGGYVDDPAEIQARKWEEAAQNPSVSSAMREQLMLRAQNARQNIAARRLDRLKKSYFPDKEVRMTRGVLALFTPSVMSENPNWSQEQARLYILNNYGKFRDKFLSRMVGVVTEGGLDKIVNVANRLRAGGVSSEEINKALSLIDEGGYSPDVRPIDPNTGEEVPMSQAEAAFRFAQTGYGTSFDGEKNYMNNVLYGLATDENSQDDILENLVNNLDVLPKYYNNARRGYLTALQSSREAELFDGIKPEGYNPDDKQYGGDISLQDRALTVAAMQDTIYALREAAKRGDTSAGGAAKMMETRMKNFAAQSAEKYKQLEAIASGSADVSEEEWRNAMDQINEYKDVTSSVVPNGGPYGSEGFRRVSDDPFNLDGGGIRITAYDPKLEATSSRSAVSQRASMSRMWQNDLNMSWGRVLNGWFNPMEPLANTHATRMQLEDYYKRRGMQVPGIANGDIFGTMGGMPIDEYKQLEVARTGAKQGHPEAQERLKQLEAKYNNYKKIYDRSKMLYGHGDSTGNWGSGWLDTSLRLLNATDAYYLPATLGSMALGGARGAIALSKALANRGLGQTAKDIGVNMLAPVGTKIWGRGFTQGVSPVVYNPASGLAGQRWAYALSRGGGALTQGQAVANHGIQLGGRALGRQVGNAAMFGLTAMWPKYYYDTATWNSPNFSHSGQIVNNNLRLVNPTMRSWIYPSATTQAKENRDLENSVGFDLWKQVAELTGQDPDNSKLSTQPYAPPVTPQGEAAGGKLSVPGFKVDPRTGKPYSERPVGVGGIPSLNTR